MKSIIYILIFFSGFNSIAQNNFAQIINCDSITYTKDTSFAEKRALNQIFKISQKDITLNLSINFAWEITNIDSIQELEKKDTLELSIQLASKNNGEFNTIQFLESKEVLIGNDLYTNEKSILYWFESERPKESILKLKPLKKRSNSFKRKLRYKIIWNGYYCATLIKL